MSGPKDGNRETAWDSSLCKKCEHCNVGIAWCESLQIRVRWPGRIECDGFSPKTDRDAQSKQEAEVTEKKTENEAVDHPRHYNTHPSGVECIQVAEHFGFNLGNVVKYIWRAEEKGAPLEDLKKAQWYLRREIEKREGSAKPRPKEESKEDAGTEKSDGSFGSAWVGREWWVFRTNWADLGNLWEPHSGPFLSKTLAKKWIAKQTGHLKGLRAGRKAVVWTAPTNDKGQQ